MDITQSKLIRGAHAYRHLYEQFVTEASFLWLLRSLAVDQPHYTRDDIAAMEQRINAQLDGLMTSVDIGWESCEAALDLEEPGEAFTAMVVALRSHESSKIQIAVERGLASERTFSGLVSALGWLPENIVQPWISKFLSGKDMRHKYLGVAACSIRRDDPGEILATILNRADCRQHVKLYARALRLIGELRRQDLMPALQAALADSNTDLLFWAAWSSILLGQLAEVKHLRKVVLHRGPHQDWAIQLAFRVLSIDAGREWISAMSKDKTQVRAVIKATGILGDPHAVNWLIGKMADPLLARLAGEAFTLITGVDLEQHQLTAAAPQNRELIPNDDTADAHVGMDEDENLPWPDVAKVTALWRNHGQNFIVGRRYFLGKPITADWLKNTITNGTQRQRHAAALELALIDPQTRLINTRAKVIT
jgi:uncharacterized protein (TIGR02270 family)